VSEERWRVLHAVDIVKDYGDLLALDGVSIEVSEGERVVLVGPNGSGKSTLVRIASGLLEATSGTVEVVGVEPGSIQARRQVSFIPDAPVLYDDLSVLEHLEYVARLHGVDHWRSRADELLSRLGLADRADDLPARFSRGLRQKTAIAVALVRPASLLLVDEPFVGLDAPGRMALIELLDEAALAGAAVVVATHQLDLAARADRAIGLRDGRKVHDGAITPAVLSELTDDPLAAERLDEARRRATPD
jgi:ABC-type multidrug transport system ATPase subunit